MLQEFRPLTKFTLVAQGNLSGAERLQKRSLAINEKILGHLHPGLAQSLNNMAELLEAQVRAARFPNGIVFGVGGPTESRYENHYVYVQTVLSILISCFAVCTGRWDGDELN